MQLIAHIKEGLSNLFASKLRSMLALLGILVGTASVVAMVLGGQLATNEAIKQFETLGTDLLAVSISEAPQENKKVQTVGSQENLTLEQASDISSVDQSILEAAPYTQIYPPVYFEGHELNSTVLGVTDSFAKIVNIEMVNGRFVSLFDKYASYCVIGYSLYQEIKKKTIVEPLGHQIQIGKSFFTIVGVAAHWPENNFIYTNIDYTVLIPILTSTAITKYANINNIIVRLKTKTDIDSVKFKMQSYINQKVANRQLYFRSAKELIARMAKQNEILTIFLGLIGGISLLVGGIGVMNIMLVSVIERRQEIGIRLAVGAKRSDIRSLFLVESIMLSLLGGTLGVIVGIVIAYIIALFSHWQFTLFLLSPLIGFTVSVAVGIFFGFYPAYQASQLNPIEALRSD